MNHQSVMAEQPPNNGHRQNILGTSFRLVEIDVLIDAHHNDWFIKDSAPDKEPKPYLPHLGKSGKSTFDLPACVPIFILLIPLRTN